ncbi:MAG TPA: S53 family peptidase [Candidatus Elarobacter sp.]|jgi:kumamolisin|nr:S53 family peptidase [Candidatus Elarobacter sp.]
MDNSRFTALRGSERKLLPSSEPVGDPPADELMNVTVYVRQDPSSTATLPRLEDYSASGARVQRSHADTNAAFAADPADLEKVAAYYTAQGLRVLEKSLDKRSVTLQGTVNAMSQAFNVPLKLYESAHGRYRGRTGAVYVPRELSAIVESVFGLDNRHVGRPFNHRARALPARARAQQGFFPPELAQLYGFPDHAGQGQTIGILSFNGDLDHGSGGYDTAVVRTYFKDVIGADGPSIENVVVHGPGNDPGDGSSQADSTGEVLLDLEVVGSLASQASIVMYFTVFTEQGWVDAIMSAVTDAQRKPSVISISYGNPEDGSGTLWTEAAILKVDEAFRRAAAANVTICAASGDDGSRDQITSDTLAHVDFPAASPWVLAVGGTHLEASGGAITREIVWNDNEGSTGGGVSNVFGLPPYQNAARVPVSVNPGSRIGRGVPDVAAVGDPETGVKVSSPGAGAVEMIGGTSASAPLWAALMARLNGLASAPFGFVNPLLYAQAGNSLNDIVEGNNGAYSARAGWDACTGLGTPNGTALRAALAAATTTGNGTRSRPVTLAT